MKTILVKLLCFGLIMLTQMSGLPALASGEEVTVISTTRQLDDLLKDSVLAGLNMSKILKNGETVELNTNAKTREIDGEFYLSEEGVAKAYSSTVEHGEDIIYFKFANFVISYHITVQTVYVNDKLVECPVLPTYVDDVLYIPVSMLKVCLGKYDYYLSSQICILSDYPIEFDDVNLKPLINHISSLYYYNIPTAEELWQTYTQRYPNQEHPRLMITAQERDKLRYNVKHEYIYSFLAERILEEADTYLNTEPQAYGGNTVGWVRTGSKKLERLSMAYMLTGDRKYFESAWTEIEAFMNYPDWGPTSSFLIPSDFAQGFAMAYDWMYDEFTEEQRARMRESMYQNIIRDGKLAFSKFPKAYRSGRWAVDASNWSAICNAALTSVSLMLMDHEEYREDALYCIQGGIKNMQEVFTTAFVPDGSWYEGVVYWSYMSSSLTMYDHSLFTVFGTDYGLFEFPGFKTTAYYPMYNDGNNFAFSYGDSEDGKCGSERTWSYWGRRLQDPVLMRKRFDDILNGASWWYREILWFDKELYEQGKTIDLSLDKTFKSDTQTAYMRSAWNDSNSLFVATRTGATVVGHGHMDTASYVFEANGVTWAVDGGPGEYSIPGYFETQGPKWNIYKARAESHNTLVVNPSKRWEYKLDENVGLDLISKDRGAMIDIDMTDLYAEHDVVDARRVLALVNDRQSFLVQDEVTTNVEGEYYWFMHTKANINIAEDGKTAILEQMGQRLYVELLSPTDAVFTEMKNEPLPDSPRISQEVYDDTIKKLAIHIEDKKEVAIGVLMTPLKMGQEKSEVEYEFCPISEIQIPDGEIPVPDAIMVNGEPLEGLSANTKNYTKYFVEKPDSVPQITAENSRYDLNIIQADSFPGTAVIEVPDEDGTIIKYQIKMLYEPVQGLVEGRNLIAPAQVISSDTVENGAINSYLTDGNLETRYACYGAQTITYDLGEAKNIDTVSIAWHQPSERESQVEIMVSQDNVNWDIVWEGKSRKGDNAYESYRFQEQPAKYVRICLHGRTDGNLWNSLMQLGVYGK